MRVSPKAGIAGIWTTLFLIPLALVGLGVRGLMVGREGDAQWALIGAGTVISLLLVRVLVSKSIAVPSVSAPSTRTTATGAIVAGIGVGYAASRLLFGLDAFWALALVSVAVVIAEARRALRRYFARRENVAAGEEN